MWFEDEDGDTVSGSQNPGGGGAGPYQFVGTSSVFENRTSSPFDPLFFETFNYFRFGELGRGDQVVTGETRRIVIVDGSTSELLFSFTPLGTGSGSAADQVRARRDEMIAAINAVTVAAGDPLTITPTGIEKGESSLVVNFESLPNLDTDDFSIRASASLVDFNLNLTGQSEIEEVSEGVYQATIEASALGDTLFMRIEYED